jgi:hypothetical protein
MKGSVTTDISSRTWIQIQSSQCPVVLPVEPELCDYYSTLSPGMTGSNLNPHSLVNLRQITDFFLASVFPYVKWKDRHMVMRCPPIFTPGYIRRLLRLDYASVAVEQGFQQGHDEVNLKHPPLASAGHQMRSVLISQQI